MKKYFIVIAFVLVPFFHVPLVQAETLNSHERAILIAQIQSLSLQVEALQRALLAIQDSDDVYKTRFYDGQFEAIYRVQNTSLVPISPSPVRIGDSLVFESFIALAGNTFVDTYIDEFRIYNDKQSGLAAFVEQKPDGTWILGVNRFDESFMQTYDRDFMTEVLLHEYAHIYFYYKETFVDDFTDTFWNNSVIRAHRIRMEAIKDPFIRNEEAVLFYRDHKDDFIDAYSASHPLEDFIESFVLFVTDDLPSGTRVKDDKVHFFNGYSAMRALRTELRQSDSLRLE